jgi:hypothetical protein
MGRAALVGLAREQMTTVKKEMAFEYPVEEWFTGEYAAIPPHMQDAIKRYVIDKLRPGSFLSSVISNDLRGAVNYADSENLPLLPVYVKWFYNRAPSGCSGNPQQLEDWLVSKA